MTQRAVTPRANLLKDGFPTEPETFGGFVHRIDDGGHSVVAVAVLVDARSLDPLATHEARIAFETPGDVLPALLAALAGLPAPPDIAFVEGLGTAGPQRTGLATRFGVATGLPCVGVAVVAPPGMHARINLHDMRGAFTPLRDGAEQVGWVLRSRVGAEPLVVSPAHRVAMPSAPALVL
ncbi:MAG TPA: endonuclease V, partial [Xanthomonadaceae bacterium]|nr:endonuclease V [Xanthomonadaceae bacterium]